MAPPSARMSAARARVGHAGCDVVGRTLNRRVTGLLCAALLACGLTACGEEATPAAATIVGRWASMPHSSQLGDAIHRYQFEEDGRVAMSFTLLRGGLPPFERSGTYALDGDHVVFDFEVKNEDEPRAGRLRYELLDARTLLLTEASGENYSLMRQ